MRKICFYAYPIILLVTLALGITMLLGYGYPLSLPLFAALCVFTPCNFHLQIKSWYLASRGITATRWLLQSQIIFFLGNLTILVLLVERYGINAGGVALLGATILALAYLLIIERRLVYRLSPQ
jgi:O-antigen/teichoic acid export membrane protein